MTETIVWQEKVTRSAAIALMHNFSSVAAALKELVDNAVNYRWGQDLRIDIDFDNKKRDRIVVTSRGGRGMDAQGIQYWLNWGEGEEHKSEELSKWHQGGKAACGFLGSHLRLWAKHKDSSDIWFIEDEDWATRPNAKDFGPAMPAEVSGLSDELAKLPSGKGFVRIEVSNLNLDRRWNLEDLRRDVSNTYRRLLMDGKVEIYVQGELVQPFEFAMSTAVEQVQIDIALSGNRRAVGWAGKLQREKDTRPVKSGLRLCHSGRLISEGEWFGYNHQGKGSLNSLIGELDVTRFNPVPNKTDFVERSDKVWDELATKVLAQLNPLISDLRAAAEEAPVSKAEKEKAQEVAAELEAVMTALNEELVGSESGGRRGQSEGAPGGRKSPKDRHRKRPKVEQTNHREPPQSQSEPPENAVGSLARLLERITGGSKKPPIRISAWDPSERSGWSHEGSTTWLDINKNYHLYKSLQGVKPYLAETAILELCKPQEGDQGLSAVDYVSKVNLMLLRWHALVDANTQ